MKRNKLQEVIDNGFLREKVWERLMKNVKCNKETGCWEYQGYLNDSGYGITSAGRKYNGLRVHRFVHQYIHGDLDNERDLVLHECDNPRCCNPEHLWKGDHLENMRDMHNKNRNSPPPRRPGDNKYCEELVILTYKTTDTAKEHARKTGCHETLYYDVKRKRTWRELTDKIDRGEI